MNATLDRGETIRRYAPEPALDIPEPELPAIQYARQLDRYVELRERAIASEEPDWINEHPRLSMVIACGCALAALAYAHWRRK